MQETCAQKHLECHSDNIDLISICCYFKGLSAGGTVLSKWKNSLNHFVRTLSLESIDELIQQGSQHPQVKEFEKDMIESAGSDHTSNQTWTLGSCINTSYIDIEDFVIWLVANGKGIEKHNASTPDVDSCGDPPPEMESDDDGGDPDDPDRVRYPPPPSRTEYANINCILESAAKAWEGVGVNRPTKRQRV